MSVSSWLPSLSEFFPPTPAAHQVIRMMLWSWIPISLLQWTPIRQLQMMGKTSGQASFLLPGRLTWSLAELVGPINMLYTIYTLPSKLKPPPEASTSILGTGLPIQHEILVFLYLVHYANRAVFAPLVFAPSVSPIAPWVAFLMVYFQYSNSANIACWIVYSTVQWRNHPTSLFSPLAFMGLAIFVYGLRGNIRNEYKLYELRRGAAKRKAKSEGKATVTYDKVYVIPPAEGDFKHVLHPHYVSEWLEWTGYWVMGGAWGLGWGNSTASLWFIIAEVVTMLPRAVQGKQWYEQKFGKRAVAGRAAALPVFWL